jgi:GT2 family glycosyltransferase
VSFVYWVQDLIGEATGRLLPKRIPGIGRPIAWYYRDLERRLLWSADAVVVISADFLPFVPSSAHVIENWAPLEDLPLLPKDNAWSRAHGLYATTNLLYSGTLGMKHDPTLLLRIAETYAHDERVRVVVISEGDAAEWLRARAAETSLSSLVVLPFQPFEVVAQMLASADVLIAVLDRQAGVFSVPSKVLTYLCAGRPLLLAVPAQNLVAKIVSEVGAGLIVAPEDTTGIAAGIARLLADPTERAAMGARARAYAEQKFNLSAICDQFEAVLLGTLSAPAPRAYAYDAPRRENDRGTGLPAPRHRARPPRERAQPREAQVSIITVSYDCEKALEQCLASLSVEAERVSLEVIVADNASHDGTVDMVSTQFPWVRLIENHDNVGFARAANDAMRFATADYLLFLNPDTVVPPGGISATLAALEEHPEVGMLGVKLVRPDGTFDHACKRGFPTVASALFYFLGLNRLWPQSPSFAQYTAGELREDESGTVDAINGAFMLVRREAAEDAGPMDERYWLYAEDLDWCHRFWERGWKVLYWPGVDVIHRKGGSSGDQRSWALNRAFHRSMWLFYEKHYAPRHPKVVSWVVWAGIWAKFALSAVANVLRRTPAHDWSDELNASGSGSRDAAGV